VRKIYPEKTKKANKRKKRRTRRGKAKQEKPSDDFSEATDDGSVATVEMEIVGIFICQYIAIRYIFSS
jgi:hypothetical protein